MEIKNAGLKIGGMVMNKSTFKNKSGNINYNLHIAMPGASVQLQVAVSLARYNSIEIMQPYDKMLSVSEYGGKVYFAEKE